MASQAAEKMMPQTNGIQREPSMEEILASIRRIIEDSDQVKKPELDVIEGTDPAKPALAQDEPVAFDTGEREEAGVPEAFVAVEPEHQRAQMPSAMPVHEVEEEAPTTTVDEYEADEAHLHAAMDEEIEASLPPQAANEPGAFDDFELTRLDQRPAIISERTGRQVAAAFEELSDAFAASRRKSFDEIAEEMMRPMLQDWLDNNLPTLVEKLVREEIERVARGAAR
jgi:cell pole-organizing protein PopZ